MTTVGWLPAPVEELFGTEATAEESYDLLTVDVPPTTWLTALRTARDDLGCTYFDWLSAVDEPGTGFRVSAHVVALSPVRRLLVRTTVPHETPALPTAVDVYAGAAWHERETHEMFGVDFEGHPALDHLLLPETFEGHPLRKDFVLAARVAKAWPGAKEPGESDHGAPKRRQMLPPGVPDPNEWGPLKGQLPAAPARPARGAGRAAGERPVRGAAGERPVRAGGERPARAAGESPVGAAGDGPVRGAGESAARAAGDSPVRGAGDRPVRRARSASEGSASQQGTGAAPPRRSRSASGGSASQQAEAEAEAQAQLPAAEPESAPAAEPSQGPAPTREGNTAQPSTAPRSTDAPWHNARPAFVEPEPEAKPASEAKPESEPKPSSAKGPADGSSAEANSSAPERDPDAPGSTSAPDTTAPAPDAVERTDPPPTSENPAGEDATPDTPTGGPQ